MFLLRQHNILFHTTTIAIVIVTHILIISSPALGFVGNSIVADRTCSYSYNRYHDHDKSRAATAASSSSSSLCKSRAWIIHNKNNGGSGTRLTMNMMPSQRQQELIELGSASNKNSGWGGDALFIKMASIFSQSAATRANQPYNAAGDVQLVTLLRVGIPSLIAGVASTFLFPFLALFLASIMNDAGVFAVLSQDSSQFVQNFLTVSGLLFSILVGQTYYFMYQQQEAVYYALFNEVTEAKSLLEQVALVCQGRSMYKNVLNYISSYVEYDLKQLQCDPAILLSARPIDDPLESIMYMTSVGVPSSVYETVRSLRQARATRLGALQRKLPKVHMLLLWILAGIELVSFPLLGAGTQTIGGYNILTIEGCLFGVMTFGIVMTMRVVGELWRPAGGAYNVDSVLAVMVKGLEEELAARRSAANNNGNGSMSTSVHGLPGPDSSTGRGIMSKEEENFRKSLRQQGTGATLQSILEKFLFKVFRR